MSFSSILGPARRTEPVVGGYNLYDGLQNWRQSLAYARGSRGLVAEGGVDVVFLGDSILHGSGATFFHTDKMINRIRQLLQARFNPADVEGGYGFLPIMGSPTAGSCNWSDFSGGQYKQGASAAWQKWGPASITGSAGLSKSICLRHMEVAESSVATVTATWAYLKDMQINHNYQQSSTAQAKTQRQAQIVYRTNSGWDSFRFDFGGFVTMPYSSAQTGAVTQSCNAAESYGNRTPAIDVDSTASATHYIQATQLNANGRIGIEGALLYCRDRKMGIRCHDCCIGGSISSDYNDALTLAGLARFGERSGAIPGQDSTNAKLVVIGLGVNDCGSGASPTVDVPTYRANLATLIASIQSWTSKPSILLWFQPCQNSSNAESRWRSYINAGKSLADQYGVAVLDFWAKIKDASHGGNSAGGYMYDRGFYNDGIHYSDKGQDWMAQETFGALAYGV